MATLLNPLVLLPRVLLPTATFSLPLTLTSRLPPPMACLRCRLCSYQVRRSRLQCSESGVSHADRIRGEGTIANCGVPAACGVRLQRSRPHRRIASTLDAACPDA